MRAVVFEKAGPADGPDTLVDADLPDPVAAGRDLLVEVRAVSVNPVDVKVRSGAIPTPPGQHVLGWDAAGVVRSVGEEVAGFAPGDEVWYAGGIARPGSDAALQLVDERLAARKPATLDWAEAAAMPLTALTAWEMLFDRLDVRRPVPGAGALLVIGGSGGVGSMAIQLARHLTDLVVIATASRPETRDWAAAMGAHHVVDHARPLAAQVEALGVGRPGFVFSTTHTDAHVAEIAELIAPQGRFGLIDDPERLDVMPFKDKAVTVALELMFTRSLFGTPDMAEQGRILAEIARLVDAGTLRTTLTERLSPIGAATLRRAHAAVEGGRMRGKLVVEGWT